MAPVQASNKNESSDFLGRKDGHAAHEHAADVLKGVHVEHGIANAQGFHVSCSDFYRAGRAEKIGAFYIALGFSWTLDCERVLAGGVSR